jgi:hypothetical protein
MRPVCSAECIIDVGIRELGKASGEGVVVAFLAGIEAKVLEQHDGVSRQLGRGRFDGHGDRFLEELCEALSHRGESKLVVNYAIGPAEVRAEHEGGTTLTKLPERRNRGGDSGVVGDRTTLERHVVVGSNEDASAIDLAEAVERAERQRISHGRRIYSEAATSEATSTNRFE